MARLDPVAHGVEGCILSSLLGPVGLEEFVANYWERAPLHLKGTGPLCQRPQADQQQQQQQQQQHRHHRTHSPPCLPFGPAAAPAWCEHLLHRSFSLPLMATTSENALGTLQAWHCEARRQSPRRGACLCALGRGGCHRIHGAGRNMGVFPALGGGRSTRPSWP